MSKYLQQPIRFDGLKTVPLQSRGGKVDTRLFARSHRAGATLSSWLDSLPRLLAADSLRAVVDALINARELHKPIIWGFGGHVIKCGLAPVLLDLMRRGFATAFATNGAGAIHDLEIALAGHTSEDVEAVLPDGSFGSARETAEEMNCASRMAAEQECGFGEALGQRLEQSAHSEFGAFSLLLGAYRSSVPVTVHVAIGSDTPHISPQADPAALGLATHHDFRLFAAIVKELDGGGVYLNVGSAVIMPEVFLKAVSAVRNLGFPLSGFTTVNCDFLQHYRPRVNVLERPHSGSGEGGQDGDRSGRGISLTGHHELMIPLLAALLVERS
jgi:hypothetical protein